MNNSNSAKYQIQKHNNPISTLPENLHSTILRTPKLPENIHKPKEKRFLPSLTLVTLLANHPLPLLTPSLGVSPSPTLSSHSKFWRRRSRLCSCAALYFVRSPCPYGFKTCAALYFVRSPCPYGFKATGVALELFLSRRSVITYANIIYKRSVILRFLVSSGGGCVELSLRFSIFLLHGLSVALCFECYD